MFHIEWSDVTSSFLWDPAGIQTSASPPSVLPSFLSFFPSSLSWYSTFLFLGGHNASCAPGVFLGGANTVVLFVVLCKIHF